MPKTPKILLPLIGVASIFSISNASALTYQSSVPVQFTFNEVLSVNLSSSDLVISNLAPGSSSDSNTITVGVSTNAAFGYSLSATVGTKTGASSALTNTTNNTYSFTNLSTTAGTASTLANIPSNYWGYSYSSDNGTTWVSGDMGSAVTGYAGLPLDNNDSADERGKGGVLLINNDGSSNAVTSVQFKIGANASSSQPSGDYTNVINFYAVANPNPLLKTCHANKICYAEASLNGDVVGTMGEQDANASTETMLLASNFSRQGYGFAGWNTQPDYTGTSYGPQETITTPSDMSNGLSLYAIWAPSAGNLQNWSGCSGLLQGQVTALTDQRDNDTYAVAKLADGNCWMIENLRLDNTNSDNSTGALSQGYASGFIGLADSEAPWAYDSTTANSLYSTDSNTSVTISGSNPYYRMPRYNNVNTPSSASDRPSNPTSNSTTNSTTNAGMYSYGNYYTWTAASTDTSTTSVGDYNAKSICPTGWSIPRGGDKSRESTNDFWTYIVTNLNGGVNPANYDSSSAPYYTGTAEAGPVANALRGYPNNFVYSGYIGSSSVYNRGSYGYYWSSTAGSSSSAYYLNFGSSSIYPGTNNNFGKSGGRSVRCFIYST